MPLLAERAPVGPQDGTFTRFVASLAPATTYFFRCSATNAAGTAWAADAESFTTTALVPSGAVINEFHYNSLDPTSAEEFIELHNPGDSPLDLSGWSLSDAVSFTFPPNTSLPVGGYLVVAENPAVILARFGAGALGPWSGRLSSKGEPILLRDAAGVTRDSVTYQAGFPWPTAPDGAGPSCELLNPALDNDLGGSWRASANLAPFTDTYVAASANGWRYRKGSAEASSPVDAWRAAGFDDSSWSTGQAAVGYDRNHVYTNNTYLFDMRNGYWSVYLRKTFTVPANRIPDTLTLRLFVDDGCVAWINGHEVARAHVNDGDPAYNTPAINHNATEWETFEITGASGFLLGGTNVLAIHAANSSLSSSDFTINAELTGNGAAYSPIPSPGAANGAFSAPDETPPQIRQVAHTPACPLPGQPVTVTARITDPDGLGPVTLAWQAVDPGNYIRRTDPAYQTAWTTVPMTDDGTGGDAVAGDYVHTAVLPGALQVHRRLVRYKISLTDALGNALTVPYPDDEQPNFAWFTYAGVPPWTGALRPTAFNGAPATSPETFPSSLLGSIPPFHLIATADDVANCQYNGSYQNTRFFGTVVHDGRVYDHIQFRVRGQGSTYLTGKNKWNVYFNRARDYHARDDLGRPFKETWNNLLINANACPWAAVNRGAAGVEEAVSNRIYEVAGMASMRTTFLHLRVIDDAVEASPTSQYEGDLWGLYLGIEPSEGNFLDERDLPDGNIYAIEGNAGDKKHQGPTQPLDSSDWAAFRDAAAAAGTTEQWYRDHLDLASLYTFLGLNRLIGNVDVRPGDNYRFYHRPTDDRWVIFPYDMDMQFIAAHHWGGPMDDVVVAGAPNTIRAVMRHPALALEYRNRCRELLDLMGSDPAPSGGQIGQLIDQFAQIVNPAGQELTWADLDAAMWNLHPRTPGSGDNTGQASHRGNFFRALYRDGPRGNLGGTAGTGSWIRTLADADADGFSDHEGMMQFYVDFSTNTWPADRTDWVRKATNTSGGGDDPDADRQKGYGYKYLEWESLYGGYANSLVNPADAAVAPDLAFPDTPTISYAGAAGFPANGLVFASSEFADPQGPETFGAMQWRIAEIGAPGTPGWVAGTPRKYEIQPTWESGELAAFTASTKFPSAAIRAGMTYRARVRHMDDTGRWSHWSAPVEFTATAADASPWQQNLVVSEINYHPLPPSTPAELAATADKNDFEFIELRNISTSETLDLTELAFTAGITFDFAAAAITELPPGACALVVKNPAAFEARYGTGLPVAGSYPNSLDNAGEQLVLAMAGTTVRDFTYDDAAPWPTSPDGSGPTLVLCDPFSNPDHGVAANWRPSHAAGGTPGTGEPTLEEWRLAHFGTTANAGPAANTADPDGDGVNNLMEYALGLDPSAPEPLSARLAVDTANGHLRLSVTRNPDAIGLAWAVEVSSDLAAWASVEGTDVATETDLPGLLVVSDLTPAGDALRRFIRLRVTLSAGD